MKIIALNDVTQAELEEAATVLYDPPQPEPWESLSRTELNEEQRVALGVLAGKLLYYQAQRANEATLLARAIYPLLMLAERDSIRAFAEVPIAAVIGEVELRGKVDGALASSIAGEPRVPFLVVVEAKRGAGGTDPVPQLLGALLCAGWNNHRHDPRMREIYGCYTVADVWTFARAACDFDQPRPSLRIGFSREYAEKTEATAILAILQSIVTRFAV